MKIIAILLLLLFSSITYAEEFTGIITKIIVDYEDSSETKYYLNNLELVFKKEINIIPNSNVLVSGIRKGNTIQVKDLSVVGLSFQYLNLVPFVGPARVLIMRANFTDKKVGCTSLNDRILNPNTDSVHKIYSEASDGLLNVTGDIIPDTFELPFPAVWDNNIFSWRGILDAQATAAGYDISSYNYFLYVVPPVQGGINGFSMSNDNYIFNCGTTTIAHELGHSFGMSHASKLRTNGSIEEYGDYSDIMSNITTVRKLNAPHQEFFRWVDNNPIISSSGIYTIYGLAANLGNPQILKIHVSNESFYYLSFRSPIGLDNSNVLESFTLGVNIHKYDAKDHAYALTVLYTTLVDGEVYTDPDNIFTARQISHNADSVTVEITLANTTNNPKAPTNIK
jgi:hypothetical protein